MNITKQIYSHEFIGGKKSVSYGIYYLIIPASAGKTPYLANQSAELEDRIGLFWLPHLYGTTPVFLSKLVIKLWRTIRGLKTLKRS